MGERHIFELDGGRVSLDFVNTVGGKRGVEAKEHLGEYADVVAWARQAGAVSDAHADRLLRRARAAPDAARAAFRRAIELREALYRIWEAHLEGAGVPNAELEIVNAQLSRALGRQRLIPDGERCCALAWAEEDELEAPLWPVAKDAAELLTSPLAGRVRMCGMAEEGECGWLFLDETKNGARRWCSMRDCGNRAKARRHYARTHGR